MPQAASSCVGGQISGNEAAVHTLWSVFESHESEAVLLVDAGNAFNSLNRQIALRNIRRICPLLSTVLINTYRAPADLFVDRDTLFSQEGTTQGDPLVMPMYTLATIPLIKKLEGNHKQLWYDAAAVGKVGDLHNGWGITTIGSSFGYFCQNLVYHQRGISQLSCFHYHQHRGECNHQWQTLYWGSNTVQGVCQRGGI